MCEFRGPAGLSHSDTENMAHAMNGDEIRSGAGEASVPPPPPRLHSDGRTPGTPGIRAAQPRLAPTLAMLPKEAGAVVNVRCCCCMCGCRKAGARMAGPSRLGPRSLPRRARWWEEATVNPRQGASRHPGGSSVQAREHRYRQQRAGQGQRVRLGCPAHSCPGLGAADAALAGRRPTLPHCEKALPKLPELGSSPKSPCTLLHLKRPGSSRRQVSMALTAFRMDADSPFSCQ